MRVLEDQLAKNSDKTGKYYSGRTQPAFFRWNFVTDFEGDDQKDDDGQTRIIWNFSPWCELSGRSTARKIIPTCRNQFCLIKGRVISSCIDRFIHVAFPARQIFFSAVFIDRYIHIIMLQRFLHDSARSVSVWDLSDMVRV
jgi:hypothetical protein